MILIFLLIHFFFFFGSLRYPDTFVTLQDNAMETKERCARLIHEGLKLFRISAPSKKKQKSSVSKHDLKIGKQSYTEVVVKGKNFRSL